MTKNYKCRGCGSSVEYDLSVKRLCCPYCGETYTVEEHHKQFPEAGTEVSEPVSRIVRDSRRERAVIPMTVLQCSSCGAELMMNRVETSSFCAYCGQPTVASERLMDYLEPDFIVPFKVTKEQAERIIRRRVKEGFFIPEGIKNFETERLRGIYIPYWLFDVYCSDEQLWKYRKDKDDLYSYRAGDCTFRRLTMEASERFNDEYSKKLEPYNTGDIQRFDAAYLSGFYSDRFDVGKMKARSQAIKRAHELYNEDVEETIPGRRKEIVRSDPKTEILRSDYALLPVWFLTFRYMGKPFTILVNGQTKKMVGAVPFVKKKAAAVFAALAVVFCIILSILFTYANSMCGYILSHSNGSSSNSAGKIVGYYIVGIAFLYGWTWITAIKRYRHMERCIGLTCANTTNRFVKERQDR
ncbi:MAG: hypothetical protein J5649_01005 [Lachnospiraceae bacterium]|nr:hypothetical protein [Lachnospiraceae bacterium]